MDLLKRQFSYLYDTNLTDSDYQIRQNFELFSSHTKL